MEAQVLPTEGTGRHVGLRRSRTLSGWWRAEELELEQRSLAVAYKKMHDRNLRPTAAAQSPSPGV